MRVLPLAFRNLLRHKRRTALSSAAIVVGVFYLVMGKAFIGGVEAGIVRSAEDGLTGHLQIRAAGYPDRGLRHPVDVLVETSPKVRALVAQEAVASTPRTMFTPTMIAGGDSFRLRAIGFDPATDAEVFPRTTWKVTGAVPAAAGDGLLVGTGVARLLDLAPGSRVVVQVRTVAGAINALDLPVSGIVSTGNNALDSASVLLTADLARELLRTDLPTHLFVRFADRDRAPAVRGRFGAAAGPRYEVRDWEQETADLLRLQTLRGRALDLLVGVLMLMACLAIANTILMAAHERVREIGTLRALGMTRAGVLRLFLLEGALMGAAAGTLGGAIGGAGSWYWSVHPIDLSGAVGEAMGGSMQFSTFLYTDFSPATIGMAVGLAFVASLLASVYPARVAAGMEPADAVRAP